MKKKETTQAAKSGQMANKFLQAQEYACKRMISRGETFRMQHEVDYLAGYNAAEGDYKPIVELLKKASDSGLIDPEMQNQIAVAMKQYEISKQVTREGYARIEEISKPNSLEIRFQTKTGAFAIIGYDLPLVLDKAAYEEIAPSLELTDQQAWALITTEMSGKYRRYIPKGHMVIAALSAHYTDSPKESVESLLNVILPRHRRDKFTCWALYAIK